VLHCNRVSISSYFRDDGPKTYWGHDFYLSRSCDVIGHVTNRSAIGYVISYWCPIGNESLSSAAFEIFASKYIWVTTLTILGYVTSSVTGWTV